MAFISKLILFPFKLAKWLILWLVVSLILMMVFSTPVEGLSERQQGAISQNCSTIQQTLSQLQKVDSRTRTYLGTTYEAIANRFITPLNLRLVKNNRPTLSDIQTEFTLGQTKFREAYTDYMRELEALIVADCKNHPDEFYQKLVVTREKRATLRATAEHLARLADQQYAAVLDLRSSL